MFMGLGTLPSPYDTGSHATGVSADGSVVVGASGDIFTQRAWRWTAGGGMVGLGPTSVSTAASGVSADGSTVVGQPPTGTLAGWRWTESGGFQDLGLAAAYAASSDGSVIAGARLVTAGGQLALQAVRWTSSGAVPITTFPSAPRGISSDGSVLVGGSTRPQSPTPPFMFVTEAFRWTSVSGMVGLGDLPSGQVRSEASAVSADGSVVVGYGSSASGIEAFRWTSAGGMVGLGDLPGGLFNSEALAVSADGSIVVGKGDGTESKPFIWDATNGMRNLSTVLTDLGLDLTGWDLRTATGISADGSTIVGDGVNNGVEQAWIAVIPEPGTGLLLMTGLLGLAYRQRRVFSAQARRARRSPWSRSAPTAS
jgi:probable HAF family extracellular repeat protein